MVEFTAWQNLFFPAQEKPEKTKKEENSEQAQEEPRGSWVLRAGGLQEPWAGTTVLCSTSRASQRPAQE